MVKTASQVCFTLFLYRVFLLIACLIVVTMILSSVQALVSLLLIALSHLFLSLFQNSECVLFSIILSHYFCITYRKPPFIWAPDAARGLPPC
jgi:hypothetical protein